MRQMTKKQVVVLDYDTGEIEEFDGVLLTRNQMEVVAKKKKAEELKKSAPNFVWSLFSSCNELFPELSYPNITRLFYIATFCWYDGRLTDDQGKTFMKRGDIHKRLNISKQNFQNFWNEMMQYNILTEDEDKYIHINKELFMRGEIDSDQSSFTRIYCTCIRNIYENCDSITMHKTLSYMFKIIPFTNRKNNIVCWNPEEMDSKNIQPMTFGDFCDCVGYDRSNAKKLLKQLLSIKIDGKHCFLFVGAEWDAEKIVLFMNPTVFYGGHLSDAQNLRALFEKYDRSPLDN